MNAEHLQAVLKVATSRVGIDPHDASPIRVGENAIFRLKDGIVARIARIGQLDTARKEVEVACWLESEGVPAVKAIQEIVQPISVRGHAVTFWHELPPHEDGTRSDVATALRLLHDLPVPTSFDLPSLQPFEHLADRIDNASTFDEPERDWLRGHLSELKLRYADLPEGEPHTVLHGDAWPGNIVRTIGGVVTMLDLERFAIGPPEWDLLHTAISRATVGKLSTEEYEAFSNVYGLDVLGWHGYPVLRDIRELRLTLFAAQMAAENPSNNEQAAHRLACLRGELGPRPWPGWQTVP